MTVPVAVLLGFAAWTLAIVVVTIGWFRLSRVFAGTAAINEFEADVERASGWYQRAQRAHANCVENLPVYAALVIALAVTGVAHPALDVLALTLLGARLAQTCTHVAFSSTRLAVTVRFTFFTVQVVCMVVMGWLVVSA